MSLGVGVIGTGVMRAEHARLLAGRTGGAHLAAVCDADEGRARAAAAATGAQVFTDARALIASPDVAAVVIASPDPTHADLALTFIAAGKPTLCEESLAATADDAPRVVGAEVALGRRLIAVGYMRRFDPGYAALRAAHRDGQIGAPVILHNIHRNVAAPDWFTGAMAVTKSFVHEIDISRRLLGSEMVAAQVTAAPGG